MPPIPNVLRPLAPCRFPSLVEPGDTVYIGRYLSAGAPDEGSLYLRVTQVGLPLGVIQGLGRLRSGFVVWV